MKYVLFVVLTLTGCAAPDTIIRATEYTADTGPLAPFGAGADGCQVAITGTIPDSVRYTYAGDDCVVTINGDSDVPDPPES